MKFKTVASGAFAAACLSLSLADTSRAAAYTETGDAGDLPSAAQVISGTAGTALDTISGSLTLTNAISDSDMFEIYISNPSAFAASNNFAIGTNGFDSQIMIFSASGLGLAANDDSANGGAQSAIPAGSFSGAAGLYFIDISGSGRYAASSTGVIFPNYTDSNSSDPTVTYGPTGPGGGNAISGYTGASNEGGAYRITLTGAQFVPAAVPEPATYVYVAAGIAGLAFVTRARRLALSK